MTNIDKSTEMAKAHTSTPSAGLHLRRPPGGRGPVGQPPKGITLQFVFYVLRRWWMVATPVGLLLAVIAAGVVFVTFEKEYEASTWLRISSQEPFLAYAPTQGERGAGDRFVQTQIELIRSPLVLSPVLSQPEAADVRELREEDDPSRWLAENLVVSSVGGSELFKISLACANAKDSAWLVNSVAHEYFLLLGKEESERSQEVIETLKEERDSREEEVKRLRENLRELTRQVTGEDPFSPIATLNPNLDHPIADINSRLITAEVEQEVLNARITVLQRELAEKQALIDQQVEEQPELVVAPGLVEEAIEQDPQVQQAQRRIELSQSRLRDLESALLPENLKENRGYQELQDAIRRDEEHLESRQAEVRERIEGSLALSQSVQLDRELAEMQSQLAIFQSELEGHKVMEEVLRERRDEKLSEAEVVGGDTLELYFQRGELDEAEGVLNVLSARILRLTTEQRAPDQVKLLRAAQEAKVPVVDGPWRMMGLASLLFFVPFGLVGAWEFLARRISNAQQLEESAHLNVIGEIAQLPLQTKGGRNGSNARVERGLTIFKESIDGLRTNLMLSDHLMDMKVLAVTSAAANEGKTSVAAQLAVNIASVSGRPTLLIDADMRSPDIHSIFDIPQDPGLAEVLSGECALEDAIVVRDDRNYTDVLPAGRLRTNPHRLLGNGALSSLLKEVRSMYDHIIIDTPPILAANETLVLAKQADKTLMCAMKDTSRIDQVKKAQERLTASGAHPIGVVLSGVPTTQYMHQYGSYAYSQD